jgi:RimJ/RimL family protein N-acetyltransferase
MSAQSDPPPPYEFVEPLLTERLRLRLQAATDVDDIYAWKSDPDVARYQLYEPLSREDVIRRVAEAAVRSRLETSGDWIELAIELTAERRVIGSIYFTLAQDSGAEIGWALTAAYHGRGYAAEAATAVLELAFGRLGLHRVYAELDPRNAASIRLCSRLGMRHEAEFLENMWFKGEWADTGVYAVLAREWAARAV